jgi:hypothetical protein
VLAGACLEHPNWPVRTCSPIILSAVLSDGFRDTLASKNSTDKEIVPVSEPILEQDAASLKEQLSGTVAKQWHFLNFADTRAVLTFVNTPPVQAAGEISATVRPDGSVALYYFSTVA